MNRFGAAALAALAELADPLSGSHVLPMDKHAGGGI
jgi:hypothetical protein